MYYIFFFPKRNKKGYEKEKNIYINSKNRFLRTSNGKRTTSPKQYPKGKEICTWKYVCTMARELLKVRRHGNSDRGTLRRKGILHERAPATFAKFGFGVAPLHLEFVRLYQQQPRSSALERRLSARSLDQHTHICTDTFCSFILCFFSYYLFPTFHHDYFDPSIMKHLAPIPSAQHQTYCLPGN